MTAPTQRILLAALAATLLASLLACAGVGGVVISGGSVLAMVASRVGLKLGAPWSEQQEAVLFAVRLPRVLLAAMVGAGLGISGATMQGLFRNPLVDPGLLGVSSGGALGAVCAIVLGQPLFRLLPHWTQPHLISFAAFAGSLAALTLVRAVGRAGAGASIGLLLLAGIAVNALAGALTGLCTFLASDAQLRSVTFWSLGSLGNATWSSVLALAPCVLPALLILPSSAHALDALLLGDRDARSLGFEVERTRRIAVLLAALCVGASVAIAGVLGFVGLVVPHLVRLVGGPAHRFVLPGSALLGAILLLWSDALARTVILPAELPLGIVTAALGAPFFLFLLVRERRVLA